MIISSFMIDRNDIDETNIVDNDMSSLYTDSRKTRFF